MNDQTTVPVRHDRIDCRQVAPARPISSLIEDVRRGLLSPPRSLPPKYFYDERGSVLFDRICDTPEYYLTRTEDALLDASAADIIAEAAPDDILELGSGMARKTRRLLDACGAAGVTPTYSPFDISEDALMRAAGELTREYPWLRVCVLVGDYDAGLAHLPRADGRRLFCFLGSTIGNFEHDHAVGFLRDLRERMNGGDLLLLGVDRVKDEAVLHAAYNDRDGLTAAFNLNMLRVLNAEIDADFDLDQFDHRAAFNRQRSRMEMHLVSRRDQEVAVGALATTIRLAAGEAILTEISRKFTPESLAAMLREAGFAPAAHYQPANGYFSLVLARPVQA